MFVCMCVCVSLCVILIMFLGCLFKPITIHVTKTLDHLWGETCRERYLSSAMFADIRAEW